MPCGAMPAVRCRAVRCRAVGCTAVPSRRCPGSDADAAGPQVGDRVDVGAVLGGRARLEVQVRTGRVAGRARDADLLARLDGLADVNPDGREVAVLGVRAVVHPDDDVVAVRAAPKPASTTVPEPTETTLLP